MTRWTSWKHQARSRPSALTVSPPVSRWIYHPAVDLIVGCGAWSVPLLLVASWSAPGATRSWAVLFYLLALALNYPHYMATVYRAYHTHDDYQAYLARQPRDVTALVNAGVLAMQLGMERDAVRKWQTALDIDPALDRVPRYLAQFWAGRADALERAGQTEDAGRGYRNALTFDERGGDDAASGVDWFNYGQFLRRRDMEPRLVMACLLHAETLLARGSAGQLETVRSAQAEVERAHPGATSAARQAVSVADALARYPPGLAP